MGDKRMNWIGFKWTEFGDVYTVIAEGEPGRWLYQCMRNGKVTGGGIRSSIDMERCVPLELAPAQPATGEGGADELATLKRALELGTAELRRYVEGNGFKWCEDEDTVFNVTTALGLMGGTIEAQKTEIATLQAQLADARARAAAAEALLRDIGGHVGSDKPTVDGDNYRQAYLFHIAGNKIRDYFVGDKARQTAGE